MHGGFGLVKGLAGREGVLQVAGRHAGDELFGFWADPRFWAMLAAVSGLDRPPAMVPDRLRRLGQVAAGVRG